MVHLILIAAGIWAALWVAGSIYCAIDDAKTMAEVEKRFGRREGDKA